MSNDDATVKISNIISIIESELKEEIDEVPADKRPIIPTVNMSCSRMPIGAISTNDERDEFFFAKPTFSERFARYFVIVIYLCGLCSMGFFLSIYYIFFWDSRMPPTYKPAIIKKPLFG